MAAYIEAARGLGKLGRGAEPMLVFPPGLAGVVAAVRGDALAPVLDLVKAMQKSPNGGAIAGFCRPWRRWRAVCRRSSNWSFTSIWCAS
jgi:nitric oxide reductase NorD protein